jgi:FxsC-like protein
VAPRQGDVPPERNDRRYYGAAPWDWSPYRPTWEQPIAEYAANFARSMGYPPYVSVLREREEELLGDGSADHPELLIIDPWAVTSPECQALLARFNLAAKPWVQVVIPWNPADGETVAAEGRLRSGLENALRRKLELGRVTAEIAVEGVPSLETFGAVLPALILAAAKRYLGYAAAAPPDGQVVEKPRLHGFAPDLSHLLERTDA